MDALPTFFDDIKQYVQFTPEDSALLRSLEPILGPHFAEISEHFYACILAHPRAHAAITGGQAQVERLKQTLAEWMLTGLRGPHDEAFYERRARIGRVHVRIALPQQYMVTAMDVMRLDYRRVLEPALRDDLPRFIAASNSLDRLFDLELAIMFQTYQEDSEERLRRRERLATIGQLAASIGHDLRNPLGVIESSLFILRRRAGDDERAVKHLDKISKQVQLCDRIVTDLLDMARNNPPKLAPVDVESAMREVVEEVPCPEHVQIRIEVEPQLRVQADPGLLQQALTNLVNNAVRALDKRPGRVELRAANEGEHVRLSVLDEGPGFDPEVLPTAFEPLVSTRAKGIGLGLALVKSVVERHGGTVTAGNRPEGGAQVDILLPCLTT